MTDDEVRFCLFQSVCVLHPPHHQNWCISPELRNRYIYLRYYTQKLFQQRIGPDKGVYASISSISDPQISSSASELTFFCAS